MSYITWGLFDCFILYHLNLFVSDTCYRFLVFTYTIALPTIVRKSLQNFGNNLFYQQLRDEIDHFRPWRILRYFRCTFLSVIHILKIVACEFKNQKSCFKIKYVLLIVFLTFTETRTEGINGLSNYWEQTDNKIHLFWYICFRYECQ